MSRRKPKNASYEPLDPPLVSQKDAAEAEKKLQDVAEAKRQRSSMKAALMAQGKYESYEAMGIADRKKYFVSFVGNKISTAAEKTLTNEKVQTTRQENEKGFDWLTEEGVEKAIGINAAKEKLEYGNLLTRPDPDSGRSTRWSIQYKLYHDLWFGFPKRN